MVAMKILEKCEIMGNFGGNEAKFFVLEGMGR